MEITGFFVVLTWRLDKGNDCKSGADIESDILLIVKDVNRTVVIAELLVPSVTSVKLSSIKKNDKHLFGYLFEIKAPREILFINAIKNKPLTHLPKGLLHYTFFVAANLISLRLS